jgi:RNA polymerase sigma-70 factor (ECF subfamily)
VPQTLGILKLSDNELVQLAKVGDQEALGALLERHRGSVLRIAEKITGSQADAEDVVQNIFLKVVLFISQFRGTSTFKTWLVRIAINESRTALRKVRNRSHREPHSIDEILGPEEMGIRASELIGGDAPSPEEKARWIERLRFISRDLMRMDPKTRETFLYVLKGFTLKEISALTKSTIGMQKSRICRARTKLRHSFALRERALTANANQDP